MDEIEELEQRVAALEKKFTAAQRLGDQESAEIRADIAVLAAQMAAFEQRSGRRFLVLETRLAEIGAVQAGHTSLLEHHSTLLQEILNRLPERA